MKKHDLPSIEEFMHRYNREMRRAIGKTPVYQINFDGVEVTPEDWKILMQNKEFRNLTKNPNHPIGPNVGGYKIIPGTRLHVNALKYE